MAFLSLVFGVLLSVSVRIHAEEASQANPCQADLKRYCSDKGDRLAATDCLMAHGKELAKECKLEMERFRQMRRDAAERGGGALSSFGGLNAMGPPVPLFSYDGRFSPGPNTPSFTDNRANLSVPVYRSASDTLALSLSGGDFHLGNPVTLSSGYVVPTNLYRVEMGAQYFDQLEDKKGWGLRVSTGSSGDKPFEDSHATTYSFSANYGYPSSGKNGYWLWSVYFSNNSPLGDYIPIPGIAYLYKTENFTGLFGFPIVSMQWTPVRPWFYSLSIFGPIVQTELGYGSVDSLQIFAGYYWTRQIYIPSGQENDLTRLTIAEMKTAIGLRKVFWSRIMGELQFGEAFARTIYLGNGVFNENGGSATVPSDIYISLSFKIKL